MNHFEEVIGHGAVIALLRSELLSPSHAYLFVGPGNVGKARVAREFAAALVGGDDDDAVRRARNGAHPDLVLVAPDGRASITVDQARSVVSAASLSPLEVGRKVFLFEEASMLNAGAANALLKSIEEPIATTTFVLVADSADDLPATVASRCRTVVFGRVDMGAISAGLVAMGVDAERANEASLTSGGRPGLAVALASEPKVAAFRNVWLSVPGELTNEPGDAYRVSAMVIEATEPLLAAVKARQKEDLADNYPDVDVPKMYIERQQRELARLTDSLYESGLELLASFYRDTAAAQIGADVLNTDIPVSSLTRVTMETAVRNASRVLDTIDHLRSNQRPVLAFATLFLDLGTDD